MSDIAIRAQNLSKQYRIGQSEPYKTLRDTLTNALTAPFRGLRRRPMRDERADGSMIWALRDVSFDVKHGEVVGIVGRNGAGKSTLLKILARITEPTQGRAMVQGRVGSLLEVGTGFNLELTGRENVYLNGAILGMVRREIQRKFDEIVAFAELEKFIDTPVKRYSSGMYMRLAFSVAAHLEPEIFIVDEVLAVGDAAFQNKCLGKMGDVAREGRTVLFVSHNMGAVQALCQSAFLLERGQLALSGSVYQVTDHYLSAQLTQPAAQVDLFDHPGRVGHPATAVFKSIRLLKADGEQAASFRMGQTVTFDIGVDTGDRVLSTPLINLVITKRGVPICHLSSKLMVKEPFMLAGRKSIRCHWEPGWLSAGTYSVSMVFKSASNGDVLDAIGDAVAFNVEAVDIYGTGKLPPEDSLLLPKGRWEL